jgi:coenzyme A diphosphatase NUDT7
MLEGLKSALAAEEARTDGHGFAAAVIVPLICRETEEQALITAAGGVRINGSRDCGPASGGGLAGARAKGIDLLFELRSRNLRRSSGEVGFPGGLLEPGEHPYEAALRELEEELGIAAKQVTLLGRLPRLFRRRNELITPYVCHISGRFPLKVQSEEVAEVFTIPLAYLLAHPMKEARMIEERRLSGGFPHHLLPQREWRSRSEYPTYYLKYQDKLIWGLTAEIVRRLLVVLTSPDKAARPGGEPEFL